jgi:hypothetical protein
MKKEVFSISFKKHRIIGDIVGDKAKCQIIFLHGAGKSNKNRFDSLRYALLKKGYPSLAFDFIGHGDTGGELSKSSLYERTEQACHVIDHLSINSPLTIIGASMSGYTSVKLVEKFNTENLILIVPAAYDKKAYKLNFNSEFTKCIRTNDSYKNSDAWDVLKDFKENLLIVSAQNDSVIPNDVIKYYYNSALQANRKIVTVRNSPHSILNFLDANIEHFNQVVSEIIKLLEK